VNTIKTIECKKRFDAYFAGRHGQMAGVEDKVLQAMKKAGKPVRPGDVAEMTGLDKDEVSKAINALKKDGKIISPKRCFWAPAD
jgi:CRP-like cAMP-binding protein